MKGGVLISHFLSENGISMNKLYCEPIALVQIEFEDRDSGLWKTNNIWPRGHILLHLTSMKMLVRYSLLLFDIITITVSRKCYYKQALVNCKLSERFLKILKDWIILSC